jgi:hypothetical protein
MGITRLGAAKIFRAWPHLRAVVALFDRDFYLQKYPDVAAAGVNPLRHYLEHGAEEGRKPHPLFDHDFYLLCCPEARDAAEPSILHFLKQAVPRGNPHPLFDCESYLRAHPEVAKRRINPLVHYVLSHKRAPGWRGQTAGAARLEIVRFEIRDVPLTIMFGEPERDEAGEAVYVWQDAEGRMRFLAPAEQRPFFAAMKYDQLRAQAQ